MSTAIDERIVKFLKAQTNLTLATCTNNIPYCANCFYAFEETKNWLVFKSDTETNHVRQAIANPFVAGTVIPDKLVKAKVQGVQFSGLFREAIGDDLKRAETIYYNRYPFARAFGGVIWIVDLEEMKMTDNTLGFGKKLLWKKGGEL